MVKMMPLNCTSVCLLTGYRLAGLINGRNVWRLSYREKYAQINTLSATRFRGGIFLLTAAQPHRPERETRLDAEVKSWFAFALQKCHESVLLRRC